MAITVIAAQNLPFHFKRKLFPVCVLVKLTFFLLNCVSRAPIISCNVHIIGVYIVLNDRLTRNEEQGECL